MTNPTPSLSFRHAFSVFLAGAVILFIELAGARLLAAVFGSSLYVWSALITVTLLSMAAGAWWGGWLADRRPFPQTLPLLWIGAAVTLGAAVPLRRLVFPLSDYMDLRLGVLLSSLVLFFLPLALLAAVTPLVVKLSDPGRENLGRVVGRLSALGTAGSCFGALTTGFLLVPLFPLTRLFLYLSIALALVGVLTLWKGGKKMILSVFFLSWTAFLAFIAPERPMPLFGNRQQTTIVGTQQSLYGQLQVVEAYNARFLFIDSILQGGLSVPEKLSISEYSPSMAILGLAAVPKTQKVLVIGLGANILPLFFQQKGIQVDVVEINPQVASLAKQWFDLSLPEKNIHLEDGRRFLRKSRETYDLVMVDVFSGEDIPAHLLTREAFQDIRLRLSEKGALVLNYVGYPGPPSSRVLATIQATLRAVFPFVDSFKIGKRNDLSNFVVMARGQKGDWFPTPDVAWDHPEPAKLREILANRPEPDKPYPFLLTDDYSPVEWLDRETRLAWRKKSVDLMQLSTLGL